MSLFFCTNDKNLNIINNEIDHVKSIIETEKKLQHQLILYMTKITTAIDNIVNPLDIQSIHTQLENLKINLDNINNNISAFQDLITLLDSLKNDFNNITKEKVEHYNLAYTQRIDEYLNITCSIYNFIENIMEYVNIKFPEKSFTEIQNINDIQKDLQVKNDIIIEKNSQVINNNVIDIDLQSTNNNIIEKDLQVINNNIIEKDLQSKNDNIIEKNITTSENLPDLKENTLIISEKNKNIILPFKISELKEKLSANNEKCKSVQDVINNYYTIPLDLYKSPAISRFRESFKLIRNKENGTLMQALNLGLELFFNSNLNPAIITACRNLDELDIYLSCLEDNELDKFTCFDIIYEYTPMPIVKVD